MRARLHVAHPFAAGEVLSLPPAPSRHLQVLRLQPGAPIALFNGDDGLEWSAAITRVGRSDVEVRIGAGVPVDSELPSHVTVAVGMPANERMDALVEKATELGVAAIQPLVCERSVIRLAGDRAEARRRHWSAVASSASEQCGRVRVPEVALPMKLDAWLRDIELVPAPLGQGRFVLSFAAEALSIGAARAALLSAQTILVLSGPEGGLAPAEEERALAAGFARLSLGPRVLRADTAPLAWLAWLGLSSLKARP